MIYQPQQFNYNAHTTSNSSDAKWSLKATQWRLLQHFSRLLIIVSKYELNRQTAAAASSKAVAFVENLIFTVQKKNNVRLRKTFISSPIISHFKFIAVRNIFRVRISRFGVFFFSLARAFHHNWKIQLIWFWEASSRVREAHEKGEVHKHKMLRRECCEMLCKVGDINKDKFSAASCYTFGN